MGAASGAVDTERPRRPWRLIVAVLGPLYPAILRLHVSPRYSFFVVIENHFFVSNLILTEKVAIFG
jgi:hypothetical protein